MHSVKKIVIIDDEKDLCLLLQTYCKKNNYQVHISHSLSDGLEILNCIIPNVVFIDNNLPDGEGWSKIKDIQVQHPKCIIFFISAYNCANQPIIINNNCIILEKPISIFEIEKHLQHFFKLEQMIF